jgi:dihydrofolate reductase
MRVSLIMTTTADGFITRDAAEDAGWATEYDRFFFDEKTRSIGTVIIGSNSFRLLPEPFESRLNIVMTSTPDASKNIEGQLEFTNAEPRELLKQLEDRDIHEVALIGGAQLNASFLNEGLVDEIYITVASKLFGEGVPLSSGYSFDIPLTLLDVQKLGENAALLHYQVER